MPGIHGNVSTFIDALKSESPLRITSDGEWKALNFFHARIEDILFGKESRWLKLAKGFKQALEELERVPVLFSTSDVQIVNYEHYREGASILLEKLESFDSTAARKALADLKRALVAMEYRLEEANGGYPVGGLPQDQLKDLFESARDWKNKQTFIKHKELSLHDKSALEEVGRHPAFLKLLFSDHDLLEAFFLWSLRDRISPRVFIEYPATQKKLSACYLDGRLGRMGGRHLKIKKVYNTDSGAFEKIVTLPFEGKDINILDDTKAVLFRGNFGMTIGDVFQVFADKPRKAGKLEFMADGIINWNYLLWGWWDEDLQDYHLVDVNQPDWWKALPAFEVISLKCAKEKFGPHLDGRQWNLAMMSRRARANLDFEESHAYLNLAIPQGDGKYAIFPFGKYALEFPATMLEALKDVGKTSKGTVAFPDENVFYTHRQTSRFSVALTEGQGLQFLESVKTDMLLSREGNLIYQIESENCAKWSFQKVEQVVGKYRLPNFFQMPFLRSEPRDQMAKVFAWIHSLPNRWQVPVTTFIHFLLGAWKGVWVFENGRSVWKSLTFHEFWQDTVIYHPSMLHKQQELGILGRRLSMGATFSGASVRKSYHDLLHKLGEFFLAAVDSVFMHGGSRWVKLKKKLLIAYNFILGVKNLHIITLMLKRSAALQVSLQRNS